MTGSAWVKATMFVLGAIMLATMASVMLSPGLGRADDEMRRVRHEDGFSVVCPLGWSPTRVQEPGPTGEARIVLAPDRTVGGWTAMLVKRLDPSAVPSDGELRAMSSREFQGQPAKAALREKRKGYVYLVYFQRDGRWFLISIESPLKVDDAHALWPFANSFKLEAPVKPSTTPSSATTPASAPIGPLAPQ